RDPLLEQLTQQPQPFATYISGIDQTLVDIEAKVEDELLSRYNLPKGNSTLIDDAKAHQLYQELKTNHMISDEFAGGTI
ncbi:inosine/guanosine kinase, partial [Shewanella sp. C31]|nr:inosine/guanosine kinase [Shewanella electrica]